MNGITSNEIVSLLVEGWEMEYTIERALRYGVFRRGKIYHMLCKNEGTLQLGDATIRRTEALLCFPPSVPVWGMQRVLVQIALNIAAYMVDLGTEARLRCYDTDLGFDSEGKPIQNHRRNKILLVVEECPHLPNNGTLDRFASVMPWTDPKA